MSSDDLTRTPAWRLAELIRSRKLSPVEVTAHFLERIAAENPRLNVYITVAEEQAMEAARNAEAQAMTGETLGPLHGVPIAIKDLTATKGLRTTYGSLLLKEHVPDRDAILVERIRSAGAIILGKTNTPEFGWKATTENLLTGACRNPWDTGRTSGGSSGGSAAALAAGLCPLATGSDAGGSIRIPSSFCGVYGLKPTFGRVPTSLEGPGGWRGLSQNGPMANNVRDAALLLQLLSGPDPRDAACIQDQPPSFDSALGDSALGASALQAPSLRDMRIAWSPNLDGRPVDPEVRRITAEAVEAFSQMGASVEEAVPELHSEHLVELFSTFLLTDLAIALKPALDAGQGHLLPPILVEWITEAASWPATRYASHLRELEWHRQRMDAFFRGFDLLLTPTMAVPASPIDQPPRSIDGRPVDPFWGITPFLFPFNMSGQPAASIPCGLTAKGLPVGLQIVGPKGAELEVLRASAAFESARPWATPPALLQPS